MEENSKNGWSTPAALSIPAEGYFKQEEGRYGPVFPQTTANYGFTVIAQVKLRREQAIPEYGKTIQEAVIASSNTPAPLKFYSLRCVLAADRNLNRFLTL